MYQFRLSAFVALLIGAVLLLLEHTEFFEKHQLLQGAAHELGFALIVAVVVWTCFEFFSQNESEKRWLNRIEVISRNVFLGVFRRKLPEPFIDEVSLLLLDHKFVRTSVNITYTIKDHHYLDREECQESFVCLHASLRLRTKCISESAQDLPIVLYLPNPLINEMKKACRVERAVFKSGEFSEIIDLSSAEVQFRHSISDDDASNCKFDLGSRRVSPGGEVEVLWHYTMAKEEEDTEIFQTLMPCQQLSLTVSDTNRGRRIVKARSIHRCDLSNDTPPDTHGTYNYSIDSYVLPHQGFAIWWKKLPVDRQRKLGAAVDTGGRDTQDADRPNVQ